jgi:hypothetical protein
LKVNKSENMIERQLIIKQQFDELIKKYGWVSRRSLAKRFAEIKSGGVKEILDKKFESENTNLSHYLSGVKTPARKTLEFWSEVIGCSFPELNRIFNPQDYDYDFYPLINNDFGYRDEPLLGEHTLRALELQCFIMYSRDSHLRRVTRHKLECLQDEVREFDRFSYYKCVGKGLKVDSPDQRFSLIREEDRGKNESYTGLKFHEPMKKHQVMDFFINFSYDGVYEEDDTFHTISIMRPTNSIIISCTPPDPKRCKQATLYEFQNKADYLQGIGEIKGIVDLDEVSNSFKVQIKKYSPVGTHHQLRWGEG